MFVIVLSILSVPLFLYVTYRLDHDAAEWTINQLHATIIFSSDRLYSMIMLLENVTFNTSTFILVNALQIYLCAWMALIFYCIVFKFNDVQEIFKVFLGPDGPVMKVATSLYNLIADPVKLVQYFFLFVP